MFINKALSESVAITGVRSRGRGSATTFCLSQAPTSKMDGAAALLGASGKLTVTLAAEVAG